ncbi:MAG TPA: hypothetical protein VJ848_09830 [Candidatus Angelobacter sp.]|nr:hypothetical protein [Candidatus Angelobacter sp.]
MRRKFGEETYRGYTRINGDGEWKSEFASWASTEPFQSFPAEGGWATRLWMTLNGWMGPKAVHGIVLIRDCMGEEMVV